MISGHQTKRLLKEQTQAGRKTPAYFQLVNVLDHARQFLPKKKEKRSRDAGDTEIESDYKLKYKHAVREVKFDLTVHSAIFLPGFESFIFGVGFVQCKASNGEAQASNETVSFFVRPFLLFVGHPHHNNDLVPRHLPFLRFFFFFFGNTFSMFLIQL